MPCDFLDQQRQIQGPERAGTAYVDNFYHLLIVWEALIPNLGDLEECPQKIEELATSSEIESGSTLINDL